MYKIIKNLFGIILIIALAFMCSSCKNDITKSDKPKVVTIIFPEYDFARAVCKDNADVYMITKPGSEIHNYEPTLGDINKIKNADLLIYSGGESQVWVENILNSIDENNIKKLMLMDKVDLLEEEQPNGVRDKHKHSHDEHAHDEHEHDEHDEHVHDNNTGNYIGYDEHIWMSTSNAKKMISAIRDEMSFIDTANKDAYGSNAEEYIKEINAIDSNVKKIVANAKRNYIAVGDRFPFLYFVKQYGLEYCAAFSGCAPEYDANPSTIVYIINEIKEHNIPIVFHIELSDERMTDTICEETGVKKLMLNSCQSISKKDFDNGKTYVDMMRDNITVLEEALN